MDSGGEHRWGPAKVELEGRGVGLFRELQLQTAGVCCERCGGAPDRAARTRHATHGDGATCYLAYLWRCSVCGKEWEDDSLKRRNAVAALAGMGAPQI